MVANLVVPARKRMCKIVNGNLKCPGFKGDDHDMSLLRLCPQAEETGKCDDIQLRMDVKDEM